LHGEHDEHGDHDAAGTAAAIDPEPATAVGDFGSPAITPTASEPAAPTEPRAESPTDQEVAQAEPAASEPPRRRSTVREPVPFSFDDGAAPLSESVPNLPPAEPAPAQAPAATEATGGDAAAEAPQDFAGKPRRTGWWAKRMLGG
jgi:ribonuclease E